MSEPFRKKLIEVALPLEAINRESARERSIRHGHPSTLHIWWARKPLAACRAVLFASVVDDPSSRPERFPTREAQDAERQRLFRIIEELVKWENLTSERVLAAARAEIVKATDGKLPTVLDPFCGGGSIPLEAQRLGFEVHAGDLNPVAVLITKALVELPPKFGSRPPINPESRANLGHGSTWEGASGLAEDIRYYGNWMRDQALERIGHLYPKVTLSDGTDATVIAWLWARTVICSNPACGVRMPLTGKFSLSTKKGNEAYVEPVVDRQAKTVGFEVRRGVGAAPGTVNRRGATCVACGSAVPFEHLRTEGRAGRLGTQLTAVVGEGQRTRLFVSPSGEQEKPAIVAAPEDAPDTDLPKQALGFRVQGYGMTKHRDLFTPRQLVALTTFSDLVMEAHAQVLADGGDREYADAVATYLASAVDRSADYWSFGALWAAQGGFIAHTFGRQALSMVWDFAEANPFSTSTANWTGACEWVARVVELTPARGSADVRQLDASSSIEAGAFIVSTDPPYYDNVPYGDLSDFFYVWLRRSLKSVYPDLFSTMLVPKNQELVADAHRFGGSRTEARDFFEKSIGRAFSNLYGSVDPDIPATIFYAFKQAESDSDGTSVSSTGWATMLRGLLDAGFAITGTWPVRSERPGRLRETGSNALASSIVLTCRPRSIEASLTTRKEFLARLKTELPDALRALQNGNIAPVDLAQAAIGPGMAIFSRYEKVVEANGESMDVRTALELINAALDETLAEQEGEFDSDTRFAIEWFRQHGLNEGPFGQADVLARAKNTSVRGLDEAGVLSSRAGKVRLLRRDELPEDYEPVSDPRRTVWEITQQLIKRLEERGEEEAAQLLRSVGGLGDVARDLAYRLYGICERKGWAQEARGYNALVVSWPELARLASSQSPEAQGTLGI